MLIQVVKDYIWLIWVVVIGAAFGIAWYRGWLLLLSNYINETKEELRKCTWPTTDELKGSTLVVVVSIVLLGAFTVVADLVITLFVRMVIT